MIIQFFKYNLFIPFLVLLLSGVILCVVDSCNEHPRHRYLNDKFIGQKSRDFVVNSFKMIPVQSQKSPPVALVLKAEVLVEDLRLPLEKGYKVIAYDSQSVPFEIMKDSYGKFEKNLTVVNPSDQDEFDKTLTSLNLVMSSFDLPFFEPSMFKEEWSTLDQKIQKGGYFIGNFFDPSFSVFDEKIKAQMTFHTKQEVLKLFKNYKILKFEEVNKGHEHFYEVFAQKI